MLREMGAYMGVMPGVLASLAHLGHLDWNHGVLPTMASKLVPVK